MIVFKDTHTFSFFKNEHVPGNRKTRTDKVTKRQSGALRLAYPRPRHGRSGKKPPTTHHRFPERQHNPVLSTFASSNSTKKRYFNHKIHHNISFRYLQKHHSERQTREKTPRNHARKQTPKHSIRNTSAFIIKYPGVFRQMSGHFPA